MKVVKIGFISILILSLLSYAGFRIWLNANLRPTDPGKPFYVRWEDISYREALSQLEEKGVIRSTKAILLDIKLNKRPTDLKAGSYQFHPGMTKEEIYKEMSKPLVQMVRIPEGRWIAWVGEILEENSVCTKEEYIAAAKNPAQFQDLVSFPLPKDSLEGYLYPDTYDLPPLLGAEDVIKRQLQAFEKKVIPAVGTKNLLTKLTVASMVELEAGVDRERAKIAAVIYNRLEIDMPLQIDATVNYARQEWGVLPPNFVRTVKSPYNTYLHKGLPPGPIGSPSIASIKAAFHPDKHNYLYYMAKSDRTHYFAETYQQHLANIRKARSESNQ